MFVIVVQYCLEHTQQLMASKSHREKVIAKLVSMYQTLPRAELVGGELLPLARALFVLRDSEAVTKILLDNFMNSDNEVSRHTYLVI